MVENSLEMKSLQFVAFKFDLIKVLRVVLAQHKSIIIETIFAPNNGLLMDFDTIVWYFLDGFLFTKIGQSS